MAPHPHTYKGHGTDRVFVTGILGMNSSDDNLKNSILISQNKSLKIKFIEQDLG